VINRQILPCFVSETNVNPGEVVSLVLMQKSEYESWLREQDDFTINWLMTNNYKIKNYSYCMIPNVQGKISKILVGYENDINLWSLAHLPKSLPVGFYAIDAGQQKYWEELALGWGLAAYHFSAFKKAEREPATLIIPKEQSPDWVQSQLQAIYLVRDLVNTPAENMGPEELSLAAQTLAKHYRANFSEIVGNDLIKQNYPAIYVVGRGSAREPRFLDLQWGDENHPKVTLVGKGVCFDTGGYNLKSGSGMALMKKDMGGAAHVLGLASLIMDNNLPIRLRVLIPAVENSVSGSAYRPGDVINTRKGLTVEVGNTDAEGRLVLSDALAEAASEKPDIIIDFATLTGAAKIATGSEVPAMFSNNSELAKEVFALSEQERDLVWQLPLHQDYKELLDSNIADLNNCSSSPMGGAITAALFLESFVEKDIPWLHFDLNAYNMSSKPGRPEGGEAMGLRAVYQFLMERYT
jgi:leucyl aminopeptidase